MMKITYYALQTLRVGDGDRHPGDLVPEAKDWPWVGAYIAQGQIAPVMVASLPAEVQKQLAKWEKEHAPKDEAEDKSDEKDESDGDDVGTTEFNALAGESKADDDADKADDEADDDADKDESGTTEPNAEAAEAKAADGEADDADDKADKTESNAKADEAQKAEPKKRGRPRKS